MTDCARYHDLVVCGVETLFEHGVIDEPPRELIQLIELGVRPLVAVTTEPRPIGRVLVAYNGSIESAKTMKRLVQMKLWPDLTLRIVTFNQSSEEESQKLLADAADYCRRHGYDPEIDHAAGSPTEQLLPYASQWNADLIVMGSSARRFRIRKRVGKTAQRVITSTHLPLFLCQ
jgi:nucleotide-binding universal stress UspA family protein